MVKKIDVQKLNICRYRVKMSVIITNDLCMLILISYALNKTEPFYFQSTYYVLYTNFS